MTKDPEVIDVSKLETVVIKGGARVKRAITKTKQKASLLFVTVLEKPGEGHTWHTHTVGDEAIYLLRGSATLTFERNGEMKEMKANAGDIVYVPRGLKHQFVNTGNTDLELVCALAPPWT